VTQAEPPTDARGRKSSVARRWVQRLLVVGAYAYPATLLGLCLAFTYLGEDWWVTAALLYVPRVLWALPLLVLVPGLWLLRRRRLLGAQALALTMVVFPLLGFVLPGPTLSPTRSSFKLMSFNVNSGYGGVTRLLDAIDAEKPDLVLLQEAPYGGPLLDGLKARFAYAESSTQFMIGSRFPILERTDPDKIQNHGRLRSPRFMRYVLATSSGKLAVYSLHPISPRGTLGVYRLRGLVHQLRSGAMLAEDAESDLQQNAELRSQQIRLAASMAGKETRPVLLAGDTNLPGLSAALRRNLSSYRDAFRSASWGLGYTFPARHAFLRLDRVMGSAPLAFADFHVGCPGVSDHLCVSVSVIQR
jgi:endonuclease/exonuclease/phosphatase family metal-dependent hydrolase